MNIKTACFTICLMVISTIAWAQNGLKLQGKAVTHEFVRVLSEVPGRWIVLGPNAITYNESFQINDLSVGELNINRRETIVLQENKECVFVGPAGIYAAIQWPDDKSDVLYITIRVVDEEKPTPKPDEPDKPVVVPVGTFAISPKVFDWAKSTGDKTTSVKLSQVFEAISAQIVAGGLKTPEDVIKETSTKNREVTGTQYEVWKTKFFMPMNVELNKLANDENKIKTMEDHATCWKEIAIGLKLYGESK